MKGLDSATLKGKAVKLKMKDGKTIIGSLPIQSYNEEFEKNYIAFLPWEKFDDFQAHFKGKQKTTDQELREFLDYIKRSDIDSFEIMETEISSIYMENGKPMPNWLQLELKRGTKPGHLAVKYKIPKNSKWFDLGEIQIKNAEILLPLTLVYLIHAKEDKKSVKDVMNQLHDNGVLTWLDEKDLLPGDYWEAKIREAIEKSDYVLVFLASKTVGKIGYKNKEIKYAFEQASLRPSGKRYIIPILLDECTPPREFKEIHCVKVTDMDWFDKLLMAIKKYPIEREKR